MVPRAGTISRSMFAKQSGGPLTHDIGMACPARAIAYLSIPGTNGGRRSGIRTAWPPVRNRTSVGFTAAACTRMRTSPGPAWGSGKSSTRGTSGPPNQWKPIAFIPRRNPLRRYGIPGRGVPRSGPTAPAVGNRKGRVTGRFR